MTSTGDGASAAAGNGARAGASGQQRTTRTRRRRRKQTPAPAAKLSYSDSEYWDKRYAAFGKNTHDWYMEYAELKQATPELEEGDVLGSAAGRGDATVLVVGCGNSTLSQSMAEDGYGEVVSVDFSPRCIEMMQAICPNEHGRLRWELMDARQMTFEAGSFDLVIDKGTLDAMMTDTHGNSKNASLVLSECYRTLRVGGLFVLITHGSPNARLKMLKKPKFRWSIDHRELDTGRHLYVMKKIK